MPQKNTIKSYSPHSYYHIFARGVNKQNIFIESADYYYFLGLFERYLTTSKRLNTSGEPYPNYSNDIKLGAYCLISNHIHLLIYQSEDKDAIRKFMSSLMTSYSKYFNRKYKRVGALFESRYKAKRIDEERYLTHISRYVHMNPKRWQNYKHSSLRYVFNDSGPVWLSHDIATQEFKTKKEYFAFLEDYQKNKDELKVIKDQLADR